MGASTGDMEGTGRDRLNPERYPSHLLSREIHKKRHGQDDDEVKDHQLVHFLPNLGLPALKPKRARENEAQLGAEKPGSHTPSNALSTLRSCCLQRPSADGPRSSSTDSGFQAHRSACCVSLCHTQESGSAGIQTHSFQACSLDVEPLTLR